MHIVVTLKQVPDLSDEVELAEDGTDLDRDAVDFQLSEWDDQALEEALLLKEGSGATVTAVALDGENADQALYTALAKGADKAVKITGDVSTSLDHHGLSQILADAITKIGPDLVLSGVQSIEDLDGQLPVLVARRLGWPHASVVTGVEAADGSVVVTQEYSGGVVAKLRLALPAVVGVQAARQAPRYAPVSKVRGLMKSATLEEVPGAAANGGSGLTIRRVFQPEKGSGAEILAGDPAEIAEKLVSILKQRGL